MPCKDSSSKIIVRLDHEDRCVDFNFSKITCSKEIGGGTGFREYCLGRGIDEVFGTDFDEVLKRLGLKSGEDQFFLYLEWEAMRGLIAQYSGLEYDGDAQRHKIASIAYDEDGVEVSLAVQPPREMPKTLSCKTLAAKAHPFP
ncbi:MAG: hypothetical protein ACE5GQ_08020 [Nitrospinales bacterium]